MADFLWKMHPLYDPVVDPRVTADSYWASSSLPHFMFEYTSYYEKTGKIVFSIVFYVIKSIEVSAFTFIV